MIGKSAPYISQEEPNFNYKRAESPVRGVVDTGYNINVSQSKIGRDSPLRMSASLSKGFKAPLRDLPQSQGMKQYEGINVHVKPIPFQRDLVNDAMRNAIPNEPAYIAGQPYARRSKSRQRTSQSRSKSRE